MLGLLSYIALVYGILHAPVHLTTKMMFMAFTVQLFKRRLFPSVQQ